MDDSDDEYDDEHYAMLPLFLILFFTSLSSGVRHLMNATLSLNSMRARQGKIRRSYYRIQKKAHSGNSTTVNKTMLLLQCVALIMKAFMV